MPIKRAPTITAKAVLIITKITIIERVLVVLKYKKGSKDEYYKIY